MSFTDPITPQDPNQSWSKPASPAGGDAPSPNFGRLGGTVLWVMFLLIAGGAVVGFATLEFGELGMIIVWPIGWAGGWVAAKILGGKSKLVGVLLVAACFGVSMLAEVIWIHENLVKAEKDWVKSIGLLPAFINQYRYSALSALIFSVFAAMSAWRQVSVRYRYVQVPIDD